MAVTTEFTTIAVLAFALVQADIKCPENVAISQGQVKFSGGRNTGSVLQYLCPEGTRAAPVSWRVCREDGTRSPVRKPVACVSYWCSGPITLENGWVSPRQAQYQVGDIVHFHCQPGYILYGATNITCLPTGKWTAPPAVCDTSGSLCGNPGVPAGGQRVGTRFSKGHQVRYMCFKGLALRGPRLRTCLEDGSWSGTQPECEGPHVYDDPQMIAEHFSLTEQALLNPDQELHLYFIIKASQSVGKENMETALLFLHQHGNKVVSFSKKRKMEVIIFGASARTVKYNLQGVTDPEEYREFLNGSGVNTGEALQLTFRLIKDKLPTGTQKAPAKSILILITDDVFVIGLGGASRRDGLDKLASQRSEPRAFFLPDYDGLLEIRAKESNTTCGVRGHQEENFGRVFGGMISTDHQWPWQVLVLFRETFIGGGSIIAPQWVLTAAHVVPNKHDEDFSPTEDITIVAGVTRVLTDTHLKALRIDKCIVHEDYVPETFHFDIALLRLQKKLNFNNKIRPVCLPCTIGLSQVLSLPFQNWTSRCLHQDLILTGHGGSDPRTISGFVTGWGHTNNRRKLSTDLMYGNIWIKKREECEDLSKIFNIELTEEKLCARGEGVDSCPGDSGGPFVIKKNGRWIQIGIVSYGTSVICKNGTTGFYTSVPRLMPWIREKVGEDIQFA
uniref:C3/C5 convertase n=1 Tax=Scleropages formosus TaxID=113540 RepID=A0A8C9RI61_SCLFO